VAASADELWYVSKLLTRTVHHGHMPEIALQDDVCRVCVAIGRMEEERRADVPGYGLSRGVPKKGRTAAGASSGYT